MAELNHRFIETNAIKLHIAEAGSGPLVLMCHGFPESWYSWRHQLRALADAGFHAVAPDQRGYGQTDRPEAISSYNMLNLVGDMVGLVYALGETPAVIVGHDWGAPVAWNSALLRPDLFRALILLSVPYLPRIPIRPTAAVRAFYPNKVFYQEYFQHPVGQAESELDPDPRKSLLAFLYSASGDATPSHKWRYAFEGHERLFDTMTIPDQLPPWLAEADLDFYAGEFKRTGFRGGLNYYRNIDFNWEMTPFLDRALIQQPTLFVAGDRDIGIEFFPAAYDQLEAAVLNLRKKVLLPGVGHWTQQERPAEVNRLMLEFLRAL